MPDALNRRELLTRLTELCKSGPLGAGGSGDDRHIVAIAGAPASGKSTLAEWLVKELNSADSGAAALLPMDGYHYDDRVLTPKGWQAQKGAPHTFDVGGLVAILQRLRANREPVIAVPQFDRDLEIARSGAALIEKTARLVVVEGNYLLLDEAPWRQLAELFDLTILVEVDEAELEHRLRQRWLSHQLSEADINRKVFDNDLPNGRLVYEKSRVPDISGSFV